MFLWTQVILLSLILKEIAKDNSFTDYIMICPTCIIYTLHFANSSAWDTQTDISLEETTSGKSWNKVRETARSSRGSNLWELVSPKNFNAREFALSSVCQANQQCSHRPFSYMHWNNKIVLMTQIIHKSRLWECKCSNHSD